MKSFLFWEWWNNSSSIIESKSNLLVDYSDSDNDDDSSSGGDKLMIKINILEENSNDYGLFMWDSSIILSWYLFSLISNNNRKYWNDKVVLELNAGVALPSILLHKLSCKKVIITDRLDGFNEIKNNIIKILNLNDYNYNSNTNSSNSNSVLIEPLSWGDINNISNNINNISSKIDFIISSDCFYDNKKNYDDIFATWYYFLLKNENLIIILTYQVRCNEKTISNYLKKWKLKAEILEINEIVPNDFKINNEILLSKITRLKD